MRTVPLRHFLSLTYRRALSHLLKCVFFSRPSLSLSGGPPLRSRLSDFPFYPLSQAPRSPQRFDLAALFPQNSVVIVIRPALLVGYRAQAGGATAKNEDFARFKGKSVLSCNSTRFPWQPFIRLFSVAMATRQKLALSLSLCPNSFFFFSLLLPPLRRLCVK